PAHIEGCFGRPEIDMEGRGDEGDREPAHHPHSQNAEIDQTAEAPLDVEAHGDQRIGDGFDHQAPREGRAHHRRYPDDEHEQRREEPDIARCHVEAPLKMPVGLTSSTTTRITKATVSLYSDCTRVSELGMSNHSASRNGRSSTDQLKTASVSAKPSTNPPAIAP